MIIITEVLVSILHCSQTKRVFQESFTCEKKWCVTICDLGVSFCFFCVGTVCIDKMPRIPKLSAINSKHNTERQLQTCSANDSVESGSNPVKAVKPSKPLGSNKVSLKSSKPNHITSRPSHMSKSYYKISYTPVRPKVPSSSSKHSQKKTTKSASQVPSTTKKLPSQTSACDSTLQKHDVNKATDVAKIAASPVSRSDEKTSSNDALSNSDTTDRPCVTPDEGVGSDTNTFTLSLDPSDYSDVDTDASASSVSDSKRLRSKTRVMFNVT